MSTDALSGYKYWSAWWTLLALLDTHRLSAWENVLRIFVVRRVTKYPTIILAVLQWLIPSTKYLLTFLTTRLHLHNRHACENFHSWYSTLRTTIYFYGNVYQYKPQCRGGTISKCLTSSDACYSSAVLIHNCCICHTSHLSHTYLVWRSCTLSEDYFGINSKYYSFTK